MVAESVPPRRRSRLYRTRRQALLVAIRSTVAYAAIWTGMSYLHGKPVDVPTLLELGVGVLALTFLEVLAAPWIVAAMKWVFH